MLYHCTTDYVIEVIKIYARFPTFYTCFPTVYTCLYPTFYAKQNMVPKELTSDVDSHVK